MVFFNSDFKDKFLGKTKYFEQRFILEKLEERKGLTKDLYERALNGLEYLSQLRAMGLNPIFKGGSAVQLLIPESLQRLSIDIDLAIDSSEKEINSILERIHGKFNKKIYNFERVGTNLPQYLVLYNIYIPSIFFKTDSKIELDFLLHKPNYKIQETQIKTFLYESEYKVKTPTIDALIGDKLTVFGPNTIGKPINENPLNFGKQLYDISILLEYFENLDDLINAYDDVFKFEKQNRNLPNLKFNEVINDLVKICKLFTLTKYCPDEINDINIKAKIEFLKRGINNLTTYTSSELKLNLLKARNISAKIAFLAKLMLLKHNKSLSVSIPMGIFQQSNEKLNKLIQDLNIINDMIKKLHQIEKSERYHMSFKELKNTDPLALSFWYGYYFPLEFLEYFK